MAPQRKRLLVRQDRHAGTFSLLCTVVGKIQQEGRRRRQGDESIVSTRQSCDEPLQPRIGHGQIENVGI